MIPARGPQTKLKCNPDLQAIEFPYNCSCLVGCHVNLPGGMQHTQNNILRARFTHAIVIFLVMHPPLGGDPGLGTLTPEQNPDVQAIGSWA